MNFVFIIKIHILSSTALQVHSFSSSYLSQMSPQTLWFLFFTTVRVCVCVCVISHLLSFPCLLVPCNPVMLSLYCFSCDSKDIRVPVWRHSDVPCTKSQILFLIVRLSNQSSLETLSFHQHQFS